MNGSDKWFHWSFNLFLFLMCFQLGGLLFLKGVIYQAEMRMKNVEADTNFKCGDFNNDESFWDLKQNSTVLNKTCLDSHCPDSFWKNNEEQEELLEVVSAEVARPTTYINGEKNLGYFVDVKLRDPGKDMRLVLVSQQMVQWNIKFPTPHPPVGALVEDGEFDLNKVTAIVDNHSWPLTKELQKIENHLKEIIIVSPEIVWLEGAPENVKITYLSPKQLCAYPIAWEEKQNPSNEFRRFFRALKEYTGLNITSFQGKKVARQFRLPFRSPLLEVNSGLIARQLSSEAKDELGLKWERKDQVLKATQFEYMNKGQKVTSDVPAKTTQAYFEVATGKTYLINKHRFGVWDPEKKKFQPLHLPLKLPDMHWPTSMTFNPLNSEIYIYNDERGGELFSYNVVTEKWRLLAQKVGYSLVALHFDHNEQRLYGTRLKGPRISELVVMDPQGKVLQKTALAKPLDFAKNRWKAQIVSRDKEFWLKIYHPASPQGEFHSLSEVKQAM